MYIYSLIYFQKREFVETCVVLLNSNTPDVKQKTATVIVWLLHQLNAKSFLIDTPIFDIHLIYNLLITKMF